jgi:acyl-CoA thioester hydrolase
MTKDYPVVVDIEVRWGDMDALVHVNNIVYFQYFQLARGKYLQRIGMPPAGPAWHDFGWIIGANCCRYKAPVTFPDTLSVWTRVGALSEDRMLMEYRAVSKKLGKVAAEGEALIFAYDFGAGRKSTIRDEVRDAILALEARELPRVPRDAARIKSEESEPQGASER